MIQHLLDASTVVGCRVVTVFLLLLLWWPRVDTAHGLAAVETPHGLSADEMCALVRRATPTQITEAIAAGAQLKNVGANQRTPLMEAVMWGVDPEVIAALLPGSDINAVGWVGRTPLMWTGWSAGCQPKVVGLLVAAGAHVAALSDQGETAVMSAIFDGDRPDIVTALVTAGVSLQTRDREGWTALDRARERRRQGIVAVLEADHAPASDTPMAILMTGSPARIRAFMANKPLSLNAPYHDSRIPFVESVAIIADPAVITTLVELGADVHVTDLWGYTPLLRAAGGNPSGAVIAELIRLGADVNEHKKDSGETPLMQAVVYNEGRESVVAALLKAHADVTAKDAKGRTVLDFTAENPSGTGIATIRQWLQQAGAESGSSFWQVVERGTPAEVAAAIAKGADVNARDENTWTVLMWAVMHHREPDVIAALLKAGARVNDTERWGSTALMFNDSQEELVPLLMTAGAQINARDSNGRTALFRACYNPKPAVIAALLKAGADPTLQDQQGKNAAEVAEEMGRTGIAELLGLPATGVAPGKLDVEKSAPTSNF